MKVSGKAFALIVLVLALGAISSFAQHNQPKPSVTQSAAQSPFTDMKTMKSEMERMRTQMEQMQTMMKDSMAKMEAAEAAMKSHMETEQASMKSQMELQHAVINHLQTITDHMQKMHEGMAMMPGSMDVNKRSGAVAATK